MMQSRLSLQALKPLRHFSGVTLGLDPDTGASWVKKQKGSDYKETKSTTLACSFTVFCVDTENTLAQATNAAVFLLGLPRLS